MIGADGRLRSGRIAASALPFYLLLCLAGLIITIFPQIARWFPDFLYG